MLKVGRRRGGSSVAVTVGVGLEGRELVVVVVEDERLWAEALANDDNDDVGP